MRRILMGLLLLAATTHLSSAATTWENIRVSSNFVEGLKQRCDCLMLGTHPTSAVLSEAWYFAKRATLSLALRSSGDAGRGFGRVGAAAALVAG